MAAHDLRYGMRIRSSGAAALVVFRGELDLDAWRALSPRLRRGLRHRTDIVVDLSAVTFIDACGTRLLERIHRHAVACGRRPRLVPGRPGIARVLRLVGLDQLFDVLSGAAPSLNRRSGGPDPVRPLIRSSTP